MTSGNRSSDINSQDMPSSILSCSNQDNHNHHRYSSNNTEETILINKNNNNNITRSTADRDDNYESNFERPSPDPASLTRRRNKYDLRQQKATPVSSFNSAANAYKTAAVNSSTLMNQEDDSLYDIPSIGKHTPLRMMDRNSESNRAEQPAAAAARPVVYELSEKNLKKFDESLKSNQILTQDDEPVATQNKLVSKNEANEQQNMSSSNHNRYSLIDYEYLDNSSTAARHRQVAQPPSKAAVSYSSSKQENRSNLAATSSTMMMEEKFKNNKNANLKESFLLADLKDTTIDEILLIADNFSINNQTPAQSPDRKRNSNSRSRIPTPKTSPTKSSPAYRRQAPPSSSKQLQSSPSWSKIPVFHNKSGDSKPANLNESQADMSFEKIEQRCLEETIESVPYENERTPVKNSADDDQQEIIRKNIEFARSNLLANNVNKTQRGNDWLDNSPGHQAHGNNENKTNYHSSSTITSDMTSASSYTSTSYRKINKPSVTTTASSSSSARKLQANSNSPSKINSNKSPSSPAKSRPTKRSESSNAINPAKQSMAKSRTPEKAAKSKASSSSTANNTKSKKKPETTKVHEITYSLDSEDASLLESTISNPTELKIRLKEELKRRKMTDELLDQLQENYDRLLEKHAEAENVIDSLRIGAKLNLDAASTSNFYQNSQISHKQPTSAHQQQPTSLTSLNGFYSLNGANVSKLALSSDSRNLGGQHSGSSASFLINNNSASRSLSPAGSTNKNTSIDQNQAPVGVIIIANRNRNNSTRPPQAFVDKTGLLSCNGDEDQNNNSCTDAGSLNSPPPPNNYNNISSNPLENLVVEQTSKLGIILQTKVLEEKMHSFITLMDEQQLNVSEQRQVYDNIRSDYENLLKSYEEAKQNDATGILPNELDMDVDLNKELGKMKDLLENIVTRMSTNFADKSPSGSIINGNDRSFRASSVSSYSNHDEIMDQYNRLLDVFNGDTSLKQRRSQSGHASPKLSSSFVETQNRSNSRQELNDSKLAARNSSSVLSHNSETHQMTNVDFPLDVNHSYSSTSTRKLNRSNNSSAFSNNKYVQEKSVNPISEVQRTNEMQPPYNRNPESGAHVTKNSRSTPVSRTSTTSLSRNSNAEERNYIHSAPRSHHVADEMSQKRATSFAPKHEKLYHEQKQQEKSRSDKSRVISDENERASSVKSLIDGGNERLDACSPLYHNHRNGHYRVDSGNSFSEKQHYHSCDRTHHHNSKQMPKSHHRPESPAEYDPNDRTISPGPPRRSPSPLVTYRQVHVKSSSSSKGSRSDVSSRHTTESPCVECVPGHHRTKEKIEPMKAAKLKDDHGCCGHHHRHHHHHQRRLGEENLRSTSKNQELNGGKSLPRAKAYEGSESEEEVESYSELDKRFERANKVYETVSDSNEFLNKAGRSQQQQAHKHQHHHHHHRHHEKHVPVEYVEPPKLRPNTTKVVVESPCHSAHAKPHGHHHHHHHHVRRHSSHHQTELTDPEHKEKLPRNRLLPKACCDEIPMEYDPVLVEAEMDRVHRRTTQHHHRGHAHRPPTVVVETRPKHQVPKSKSELIKNLNNEVEILKQKILKGHKIDEYKQKYNKIQTDDSYDDEETLVDDQTAKKPKQYHEASRDLLRGSKSMENINRQPPTTTTGFLQPSFVVNDRQVPVGSYLIQAVPTDPAVYPQIFYAVHPAISNLPPPNSHQIQASSPTVIPLSEINQNKQPDSNRLSHTSLNNKFNHRPANEAASPVPNLVNPSQNLFTSASYVQMPANPIPSNNGPQVTPSSRQQQPRKVRYYIREYGDITSDNEIAYNRSYNDANFIISNDSVRYRYQENNPRNMMPNDANEPVDEQGSIEDLLDRSFKFALIVNKKSKRIIEKIRSSVNIP